MTTFLVTERRRSGLAACGDSAPSADLARLAAVATRREIARRSAFWGGNQDSFSEVHLDGRVGSRPPERRTCTTIW